jgi:hypothetical protein
LSPPERASFDGLYRSIAPEAKVVLVKIGKAVAFRKPYRNGLRWVLANKDKYGHSHRQHLRGGDFEQSYLQNSLVSLVEET